MSLAGFFGGGTFATAVAALIRAWPGLRRLDKESDAGFRSALMDRINGLERAATEERRECDRQLREMRDRIDAMQGTINGLIRQLMQFQVTTGHALPIAMRSPEIEAALTSVEKLMEGRKP